MSRLAPFRETDALLSEEERADLNASEGPATDPGTFSPVTVEDLLQRHFPPRETLLSPFLARKTLSMIYGNRGCGKTWTAGGIALAVASGGPLFDARPNGPGWAAPSPRHVLLVDGEMPASMIRDRFALLIAGREYAPGGRLRILPADLYEDPLPSISTSQGQAIIDAHIGNADLVIFDNISTLFRGLDENDGGQWQPVQDYLLALRRRGLAVVLMHHSGKNGTQRGTSRREDILDNVVALRIPEDHLEEEGARVHVVFEKARGLAGRDVEPFEARLRLTKAGAVWDASALVDLDDEEILKLHRAGKSQRQIAEEIGKDQSTVSRRLRRLLPAPRGDA